MATGEPEQCEQCEPLTEGCGGRAFARLVPFLVPRHERRDGNLPLPLSGLVGRDQELVRIESALDAHRLVTLVGPGGGGETRLAARY